MQLPDNFKPAEYYIYELKEGGEVVFVGITKNPEKRLKQHVNFKPHKVNPNSSHGMFYGRNVTLDVVAGFEEKKEALEALEILKEENYKDYEERKIARARICSRAGKSSVNKGNHNMFSRYLCSDGHLTNGIWLKKYCEKNKLDHNKAKKVV